MSKIQIVFWTMTGNTQIMADFIADAAKQAGAEVAVCRVGEITAEEALKADILALGCPAMGAEELESAEFEPFFEQLLPHLAGHKLALFGSYGWGGGEWMRSWEQQVVDAGANLLREGLIAQERPNADAMTACEEFGKALAQF